MAKINKKPSNSIKRSVDSDSIAHPTAIKQSYIGVFVMFIIAILLLFLISPRLGLMFLLLPTIYLLYYKRYIDIFIIWGSFFFIWYLIFTGCLFGLEGEILISPEALGKEIAPNEYYLDSNTEDIESIRILLYLVNNYGATFFSDRLGDLCMQTLLYLTILSRKLGRNIYVPSLLKALLRLLKFIFRRRS